MISRKNRKIKLAEILIKEPRLKAGLSRNGLAIELFVSPKTIQNWEESKSFPDLEQIEELHHICGTPLEAYYKCYKYETRMPNANKKEKLMDIVNSLTEREVDDLIYMLSGNHGSSTYCYLQKCVADLQSPLKDRQTSCTITINSYKNAKAMGLLTDKDEIQPDMEALIEASEAAMKSIIGSKNGYTTSK